ncbi:MAG: PfkB family carbohydrate kinase [Kiritimatiellae bacterium]|nr:PfkB family carbohydrate kinase [Kiritimatiellia bacterium]
MALTIRRAEELVARFPRLRIAVVGDLMLDRYIEGEVERISPEAPVPVVRVRAERAVPGGASNVAANLRAMGARAVLCGRVGTDAAGQELLRQLQAAGIETDGVCAESDTLTTVKTRVLAERQQVCRVDHERLLEWDRRRLAEACARVSRSVRAADGLIVEDYGKGYVVQAVVDAALREAGARRIPAGLDPKENRELRVRGFTVATPNRREAFAAVGLRDPGAAAVPLEDRPLLAAARALRRRWAPDHLLVTLGPQGMLLLASGRPVHIPTRAIEVYDVSGAGDTVIAVDVLALAAGAQPAEAAELANYAAGVVVAKLGTATCTPAELLRHMRECGAPEG